MRKLLALTLLLLAIPGMSVARNSDPLLSAAYRLDRSAQHFHDQLHHSHASRDAIRDARDFRKLTRRLIRDLERGRRINHVRLRSSYHQLSGRFHRSWRARQGMHRHRNPYPDFMSLVYAFEHLNRHLHGIYERDRRIRRAHDRHRVRNRDRYDWPRY